MVSKNFFFYDRKRNFILIKKSLFIITIHPIIKFFLVDNLCVFVIIKSFLKREVANKKMFPILRNVIERGVVTEQTLQFKLWFSDSTYLPASTFHYILYFALSQPLELGNFPADFLSLLLQKADCTFYCMKCHTVICVKKIIILILLQFILNF